MSVGHSEEKKQRKRASLMDSAFQLFTTKGIAKTSVDDIVDRAGVAKGTFYLYFKDKYDLHGLLIRHKSEQLIQHALACSGYQAQPSAADKLLAIADDILEQLQENHRLLQFLNREPAWTSFRRAADRSVLEEIFGGGALDDPDGQIEIYTVLELIGSTCRGVILESDPVDMDTFRPYLHRSIRAIMSSFRAA